MSLKTSINLCEQNTLRTVLVKSHGNRAKSWKLVLLSQNNISEMGSSSSFAWCYIGLWWPYPMDTSAKAYGLTLLTFGNEELKSDWTTTWSRTKLGPQVLSSQESLIIKSFLIGNHSGRYCSKSSAFGRKNREHQIERSSHHQSSELSHNYSHKKAN